MQFDAITKLRLSFLALGVLLFLPLFWLIHAVNVRVEAQRRLRHQVVAERIFDELERELTRVLDEESARPSASFDGEIASSSFEPYVVGYFKTVGPDNRLHDAEHLDPERRKRLTWALAQEGVIPKLPTPQLEQQGALEAPNGDSQPTRKATAASAPAALPVSPAPAAKAASGSVSPADVLRKLNRAKDERQQQPSFGYSR